MELENVLADLEKYVREGAESSRVDTITITSDVAKKKAADIEKVIVKLRCLETEIQETFKLDRQKYLNSKETNPEVPKNYEYGAMGAAAFFVYFVAAGACSSFFPLSLLSAAGAAGATKGGVGLYHMWNHRSEEIILLKDEKYSKLKSETNQKQKRLDDLITNFQELYQQAVDKENPKPEKPIKNALTKVR